MRHRIIIRYISPKGQKCILGIRVDLAKEILPKLIKRGCKIERIEL